MKALVFVRAVFRMGRREAENLSAPCGPVRPAGRSPVERKKGERMKRLCAWCLALGMACGTVATAEAADIRAKGVWDFLGEWSNVAPRNDRNDRFGAMQRLRTQVDVIASKALKGVVFFEIGNTGWGNAAEGGALGTDGKMVEIRYSYIDWQVPDTELRVRMGLQPIRLPGFVAHSPVFGHDMAGVTVSQTWSDEVGTTLFWARLYNDNFGGWKEDGSPANGAARHISGDAMDMIGLVVPVNTEAVKVSPWGMYGFLGTRSLMGNIRGSEPATWAPRAGLYPILGSGYTFDSFPFRRNTDEHGDGWWLGVTGESKFFSPLTVAADFAYGSVRLGEIPDYEGFEDGPGTFKLDRAGWYAALRVEYDLGWGTPGVIAWYGSGDDGNPYNGSERMPQYNTPWAVSALGFGGGYNDMATWKVLGHNPGGLWGVVAHLKDMSFMDKLKHTLRAGYYRGTNNSNMPKAANMTAYPTRVDGPFAYLTPSDDAWELNADTRYKLYDNLELDLEAGYVRLNLDEGTWGRKIVDDTEKNSYRFSIAMRYTF